MLRSTPKTFPRKLFNGYFESCRLRLRKNKNGSTCKKAGCIAYGNELKRALSSQVNNGFRFTCKSNSRQSLEDRSNRQEHQRTKKTVPKWYCLFVGAPGRIRTCDLPVRSRALYPLSYGRVYLRLIYYHINSQLSIAFFKNLIFKK